MVFVWTPHSSFSVPFVEPRLHEEHLSYLHLAAFFNGTEIKRKFAPIWDIFVPLPTTLFEEIPILVAPSISHYCVKFQDGAVFLRGFADLPKLQLLQ